VFHTHILAGISPGDGWNMAEKTRNKSEIPWVYLLLISNRLRSGKPHQPPFQIYTFTYKIIYEQAMFHGFP